MRLSFSYPYLFLLHSSFRCSFHVLAACCHDFDVPAMFLSVCSHVCVPTLLCIRCDCSPARRIPNTYRAGLVYCCWVCVCVCVPREAVRLTRVTNVARYRPSARYPLLRVYCILNMFFPHDYNVLTMLLLCYCYVFTTLLLCSLYVLANYVHAKYVLNKCIIIMFLLRYCYVLNMFALSSYYACPMCLVCVRPVYLLCCYYVIRIFLLCSYYAITMFLHCV
jgi:hypothetical protein